MKPGLKTVSQTAMMTAILIVLQFATKPLGQIVTGTCVNFVLASSVILCGLWCGMSAAVLSPLFAFLLGIGPVFLPIVPGICLGNIALVAVIFLISRKTGWSDSIVCKALTVSVSSIVKFLVLFLVIIKIIVPFLNLSESQSAVITASFTWPQLVTALLGTSLSELICPRLRNIVK